MHLHWVGFVQERERAAVLKALHALLMAVTLACVVASPSPGHAAGFTLSCARADVFNPRWNAPLTFVFSGEKVGTLAVSGVFGAFSVPAKSSPMPIQGTMGEAIDAVANAHVQLPKLADVEGCIEAAAGSAAVDVASDAYANARDACMQKLPPTPEGADAIAEIRLGFTGDQDDHSGEDAFVVFKLRYEAPSRRPDGKMTVEVFPAHCVLQH